MSNIVPIRSWLLACILVPPSVLALGCDSLGDECETGATRCVANRFIDSCEESIWIRTSDCADWGRGCSMIADAAECRTGADADTDADSDTDTDADADTDADSDTDTDDCDASGEGYWNPAWAALECEILRITNQRRAEGADCGSEGTFPPAPPLVMQAQLREAARFHSQWMGDQGGIDDFSHDSPGGPNGDEFQDRIASAEYTGWSTIGENIAAGRATAAETMNDWMGSDGHCANIMKSGERSFTEIGIGYASVPGSYYTRYWTQDFGGK